MTLKVNPEMIILAREAQGFTQAALAESLSLTQATVSRYESGLLEVPREHVVAMALVLRRPESFFFWQERLYNSSCLYHRKNRRLSVFDLKLVHARVNMLRIQAANLLRTAKIQSDYAFHRLDVQRYGGPAGCARELRRLWQLPTGPIRSVVHTIESAGGVVFRCPFGGVRVDGISQWPMDAPHMPPVFFVNEEAPGDRERWTLCHEIGHVVMHHLPTDDPEEEANLFANEFLAPAEEIGPELSGMTLPKAAALKGYWKVSMQAIIRRAYELGKISQNQYQYLFRQLSARGYRKCEPIPMPPEEPEMFREILRVHRDAHRRSERDLSESLGMLEDDFRDQFRNNLSGLRLVI